MVFNDTTNKENGIIQGIEGVIYNDYGDISGDTDLLRKYCFRVNTWQDIIQEWIRMASGDSIYDDSNNTDFPIESYSFTDDQEDYGLDADIIHIKKVEVRNAKSLDYSNVDYLGSESIPEDEFGETKGTPLYYYFIGRSIIFYPKPNFTLYDKYRLTYARTGNLFSYNDTTTSSPGFHRQLHPGLVYGPAREEAYMAKNRETIELCDRMMGDNPNNRFYRAPNTIYGIANNLYKNQYGGNRTALKRQAPSGGSWK